MYNVNPHRVVINMLPELPFRCFRVDFWFPDILTLPRATLLGKARPCDRHIHFIDICVDNEVNYTYSVAPISYTSVETNTVL